MGSLINLAVRKGGKVKTALSNTNIIAQLFNPALYDGSNKALRDLISACDAKAPEDAIGAGLLAPFDCGLIVFDCDRKAVSEMHTAMPVQTASIVRQTRPWEHLLELAKRHWLGGMLYNAIDDSPLTPFPMRIFASVDAMKEWAQTTYSSLADSSKGRPPLAAFKIQPAEWTFKEYSESEATTFRNTLTATGFDVSNEALAGWDTWTTKR